MRRVFAVLALLACAGLAEAKTLIIGGTTDKNDATYGVADAAATTARVNMLTRILDTFGASYTVVHPSFGSKCRAGEVTDWARTGTVNWNCGSTGIGGVGAYAESYDAVIVASFTLSSASRDNSGQFRPESLSTVTKVPHVPVLLLGSDDARSGISGDGLIFSGTTSCSLAVAASKSIEGPGSGSGTHDEEAAYYQNSTITDVFCGTLNMGRQPTSAAQVAGKGYRTLLAHGSAPIGVHHQGTPGWRTWSSQWDSTGRQANPDTAQAWMIQNTHVSGAKPIICAWIADKISDDGGSVTALTQEHDIPVLMAALAALDSASGGKVFDNKATLPLRVAITIDGLCARSGTTNSGGILPSDTTQFYGTLDSLAAIGIPVVFGVNIDSVSTYSRDLQYAMTIPEARFSPQGRAGLDSAVAGNGVAQRYQPRDAFRRYRNASVAVGPGTGATAADTSLYALLSYAISKGDSLWGRPRSSRFALPPDDDWSPYNFRATQQPYLMDSLFYAYRKAGFRGIRINGYWIEARANRTPTNPRGFFAEEGNYPIRFGTTEKGDNFSLLAHNASSTFGSVALYSGLADSAQSSGADYPQSMTWNAQERFWLGLFGYWPITAVGIDGSNGTGEGVQRVRIFRMSAQELAGPELASSTWKQTSRPGWWAIRQVVMPINIMNRLAGRTLMVVDYPENCQP